MLPVDDEGLEVRPARREEVVYVSRDPGRVREPVTIERLAEAPLILYDAHYGWSDPTRRQLQERAQRAGVQLEPVIEIEDMDAALELTASGLGDTIAPKAALSYRPSFRTLGRRRSPSRSTTTSPSSPGETHRSHPPRARSSSSPSGGWPSSARASSTPESPASRLIRCVDDRRLDRRMQASPGGEVEVELAPRAGAVADARQRHLEHRASHRLGRAERPTEKLDQVRHERRLADPDPHVSLMRASKDDAPATRSGMTKVQNAADPEQTDGRPPDQAGAAARATRRRCPHHRTRVSRRFDPKG